MSVSAVGSPPASPGWDAAALLPDKLFLMAPSMPLPPALKSAGLITRCGRFALTRLEPLLRLVAPQHFRPGGPPPQNGGALSRYTVELLLRALLPALPAPVFIDELMAVCAQPIPDRSGRHPAAAAAVASSGALLAPLCCALAPLVQEAPRPAPRKPSTPMSHVAAAAAAASAATAALGPGARFWFMLLDRDADGELGGNDLFYWLHAPTSSSRPSIASRATSLVPKGFGAIAAAAAVAAEPQPMQSLVELLVRIRSQETSQEANQEGGSFWAGEVTSAQVGLEVRASELGKGA